jgi:aspartate/methionine/tyrosine aminotransferase
MSVFGQSGVNILLPRPGYPKHEAHAVFHKMEVRHYDLVPERGWEIDLEAVEALADENTVAIVIINPNNPCGSVYTYEHLSKVSKVFVQCYVAMHYLCNCVYYVPVSDLDCRYNKQARYISHCR